MTSIVASLAEWLASLSGTAAGAAEAAIANPFTTGAAAGSGAGISAAGPGAAAAAFTLADAAELAALGYGAGSQIAGAHAARPDAAIAEQQALQLKKEQEREAELTAEENARRRVLSSGRIGRGLLAFMPNSPSSTKQTSLGA